MGRLDGKVVLISGGARGQGALEAELFVAEGARVVFGDVLDDEGQSVERRIAESGGEAVYVHLDVTSDADWDEAVATAEGRFGRLDVLVNNAGIANNEKIEDTSEELWERIMLVNVKGVFLGYPEGAARPAPGRRRLDHQRVVHRRYPGAAADRRRLQRLQGCGAHVHQDDGHPARLGEHIRCNSIHPGPVDTPMLAGIADDPVEMRQRTDEVPLGRLGVSRDIAYGALYLASDEAVWITGIELVIDGGITAK